MDAKHTPGPWTANNLDSFAPIVRVNMRLVAAVHDLCVQSQHDEDVANARLISAAPDLLVACRALLSDYVKSQDVPELAISNDVIVRLARAAIQKATQ